MKFELVSPATISELLRTINDYRYRPFRFCAGGTDLMIELKRTPPEVLTVINLSRLDEPAFKSVSLSGEGLRIGALVTVNNIAADDYIRESFPTLHEAAHSLASCQIREVATVGGNLCTASPAGDVSCALMALNAKAEILNTENHLRVVPLEAFFTGVRKTILQPDEILRSVIIKPNQPEPGIKSGFIKVGTRRSMECAVVSLAYHILCDSTGTIMWAGIAIGSAAPTIVSAVAAADYLCGKKRSEIDNAESEEFARLVISCAAPISDVRASAWYRREALLNVSKGIFDR